MMTAIGQDGLLVLIEAMLRLQDSQIEAMLKIADQTNTLQVEALLQMFQAQIARIAQVEASIAHLNGRFDQLIHAFNALLTFLSDKHNLLGSETIIREVPGVDLPQLERIEQLLMMVAADLPPIKGMMALLTQRKEEDSQQLATIVESIKSVRNEQKPDTSTVASKAALKVSEHAKNRTLSWTPHRTENRTPGRTHAGAKSKSTRKVENYLRDHAGASVREIATATGVPKSTVHDILSNGTTMKKPNEL